MRSLNLWLLVLVVTGCGKSDPALISIEFHGIKIGDRYTAEMTAGFIGSLKNGEGHFHKFVTLPSLSNDVSLDVNFLDSQVEAISLNYRE